MRISLANSESISFLIKMLSRNILPLCSIDKIIDFFFYDFVGAILKIKWGGKGFVLLLFRYMKITSFDTRSLLKWAFNEVESANKLRSALRSFSRIIDPYTYCAPVDMRSCQRPPLLILSNFSPSTTTFALNKRRMRETDATRRRWNRVLRNRIMHKILLGLSRRSIAAGKGRIRDIIQWIYYRVCTSSSGVSLPVC